MWIQFCESEDLMRYAHNCFLNKVAPSDIVYRGILWTFSSMVASVYEKNIHKSAIKFAAQKTQKHQLAVPIVANDPAVFVYFVQSEF